MVRSALEAHQLNSSYKTLTHVLLLLRQGTRNGCWSSQRQQKGFSSSGVTQQTLLLGETARLTVQELFLQHSPKIVVLAQWAVGMLQHTNEDKWSGHGNSFFYGPHTQAQFPQMTPQAAIMSVLGPCWIQRASLIIWVLSQIACSASCQPPPPSGGTGTLSTQNKQSQNTEKRTTLKTHSMSPIRSCFNTIKGKATNVYG